MAEILFRVVARTDWRASVRFAFDEDNAKNIARGFKGRARIKTVDVEELHYEVVQRPDLAFRREA
ncbi:hypothetical protein [Streptomyces sp. NPDC005166]